MNPSFIMYLAMITSWKENKSQILCQVCCTFHQLDNIFPNDSGKMWYAEMFLKANYDTTLSEFVPLQPLPSFDLCIVRSSQVKVAYLLLLLVSSSFKLLLVICLHPTFRSLMHIIFQMKKYFCHQTCMHCINQEHIPIQQEI